MRVRKWVSGILVLMFFSTAALWAASYMRFYYRMPSALFYAQTGGVQIQLVSTPWEQNPDSVAYRRGWTHTGYRGLTTRWWPSHRRGAGFSLTYIPLWIPTVLFAGTFVYVYRPYRRYKHRKRHGLCLSCGYNLTGNESGTCPECGTGVEP